MPDGEEEDSSLPSLPSSSKDTVSILDGGASSNLVGMKHQIAILAQDVSTREAPDEKEKVPEENPSQKEKPEGWRSPL